MAKDGLRMIPNEAQQPEIEMNEQLVEMLNRLVFELQNPENSYTGDSSYDCGYENGRRSAGYDLEEVLRQAGLRDS